MYGAKTKTEKKIIFTKKERRGRLEDLPQKKEFYMNNYQKKKGQAIQAAQEWQQETSNTAQTYGEIYEAQKHFEKIARRYGLIKEFKENGIL